MTPMEILTPVVLLLAFIGYVWCLSRYLWVTVALTAALAFYISRSLPWEPAHLIYWAVAGGVFVTALLAVSFLPQGATKSQRAQGPVTPSRPRPKSTRKDDLPGVVVDGTNVIYWDGEADLRTLRRVVDHLRAKNLMPHVFLDASTRHHLGDKSLDAAGFAEALGLARDRVVVCPAQTEADAFLLKFAKDHNLPVVSNDRFGDRAVQAKGLKLVKGVMAGGKPVLQGL